MLWEVPNNTQAKISFESPFSNLVFFDKKLLKSTPITTFKPPTKVALSEKKSLYAAIEQKINQVRAESPKLPEVIRAKILNGPQNIVEKILEKLKSCKRP